MYDYRRRLTWAELKVGLVVTLALAILFLTVMFAGNIRELLAPKTRIYAFFDDVKGLREGAPVWFSGIEIGSVRGLEFAPDRGGIRVMLSIDSSALRFLKKDSGATIHTLGLLGDKYVEISPGSKEAEGLRPGEMIAGAAEVEFQDIVRRSQESLTRLTEFMRKLEAILVKIEKGEGTVSKFLTDPTLYNNLKEATSGLARLIERVESGKGALGGLLRDEALYGDIRSSVQDVRAFAERLRTSEGTLRRLMEDTALYDRFLRATESLERFSQRLVTARGTVNRLIEDESLYNNINEVSEKLNVILRRIDRGEGLMGSLVRDEELSEELKTTVKELKALIREMKEHPERFFKFSIF